MSQAVRKGEKPKTDRPDSNRKRLVFGLIASGIMSFAQPSLANGRPQINCSVENGIIKYGQGDTTHTLQLDIHGVRNNPRMFQNRNFTAMIDGDRLVVAIGGQRVMDGHTILGSLGGSITLSNSYAIPLREPISRRIKDMELGQNDVFTITVADGTEYRVNLNNPFEWIIR